MSALVARALEEVNRLRAERNLPTLAEMPKARAGLFKSEHCPLAVALEARVGLTYWGSDASDMANNELSAELIAFREAFDNDELPEFEA